MNYWQPYDSKLFVEMEPSKVSFNFTCPNKITHSLFLKTKNVN